jgi:hypothetical protein
MNNHSHHRSVYPYRRTRLFLTATALVILVAAVLFELDISQQYDRLGQRWKALSVDEASCINAQKELDAERTALDVRQAKLDDVIDKASFMVSEMANEQAEIDHERALLAPKLLTTGTTPQPAAPVAIDIRSVFATAPKPKPRRHRVASVWTQLPIHGGPYFYESWQSAYRNGETTMAHPPQTK